MYSKRGFFSHIAETLKERRKFYPRHLRWVRIRFNRRSWSIISLLFGTFTGCASMHFSGMFLSPFRASRRKQQEQRSWRQMIIIGLPVLKPYLNDKENDFASINRKETRSLTFTCASLIANWQANRERSVPAKYFVFSNIFSKAKIWCPVNVGRLLLRLISFDDSLPLIIPE